MKVYKLDGKGVCSVCGGDATLYIDVLDAPICRRCGVEMYRELGIHFVPRAVPNVILRSEGQDKSLSAPLYERTEQNQSKLKVGSDVSHAPFKAKKSTFMRGAFKGKLTYGSIKPPFKHVKLKNRRNK